MSTNNYIKLFLFVLYSAITVFFFFLFIEESPYGKKPALLKYREVFSVGWNFFTKDPRNDRTQIYYFDHSLNSWQEIGNSNSVKEKITRITDALQMDIYNYANQAPDSLWIRYNSQYQCLNYLNKIDHHSYYYKADYNPGKWLSKEYIKSNYSDYFLVIISKKMPWAWLKNYSQMKMKCKSLIMKL
jgi:hypothetical protein